ncbi:MAG TPA: hypothetical protein PKC72_10320 [Chitinophagaceae bacterium]|nr:hypothetical protein [Chitinophagaceae bacterium]
MTFLKALRTIVLICLASLIIFDIAGVLLVTILPGPGSRRLGGYPGFGSVALYYTVWLVAGCFAGFFFSMYSFEKTASNVLIRQKPIIVFITALVLSIILILVFYWLGEMQNPRYNFNNDYYVPGHRNVTFAYFISFLLVCLLSRNIGKKD